MGTMKKTKRTLTSTIITGGTGVLILFAAPGFAQSVPADAKASEAIRPFQINIPEAALTDLRKRVLATRWPDKETVADQSQGLQLSTMQALANYWATKY